MTHPMPELDLATLDALKFGYLICDAQLRISAANPAASVMLGAALEHADPLLDRCLALCALEPELHAIIARARPALTLEQVNIEDPAGKLRYLTLTAMPHRAGLIVIISDLTAQSQQQQQTQQQRYERTLLHKQLAEKHAALAAANAELEQRSQQLLNLLAVLTHDVRAPLIVVQETVEALRRGEFGALSAAQHAPLERIGRQTRAIQQGLTAQPLERPASAPPVSTLGLNLLVRQVLRALQQPATRRSIRLVSEITTERLIMIGVWDQIQELLTNLTGQLLTAAELGATVGLSLQRAKPRADAPQAWCELRGWRSTGADLAGLVSEPQTLRWVTALGGQLVLLPGSTNQGWCLSLPLSDPAFADSR